MTTAAIPHRSVFRAQEVCELAEVQPYVLRSWEAEFPDLGVSKGADGPRLYRRADVELVLKLKHLLFVDGLTLSGARRQLIEEGAASPQPDADVETITDADVAALVDKQARKGIHEVRQGLGWILDLLGGGAKPSRPARQAASAGARARKSVPKRSSKPVKSKSKPARPARSKRTVGRKKR